jgi:glycosyltransferase involved in cell wall biosynthesis
MAALRIAVYPHAMTIGGSQLNAVELAAAVQDLGHEVVVVGEPGPLAGRVRDLGLEHVPIPLHRPRPSLGVTAQLRGLVRRRGLEILHGYEWPPGLECAAAAYARPGTAAVCTVMSMSVAPFLPDGLPLVVGTDDLRERSTEGRGGPVHLIEPPVDVLANAPGHPVAEFRAAHGLEDPDGEHPVELVIVCRLVAELKLEGVLTAVDVAGDLAREVPVRLTVVGDGPAGPAVRERALKANARAGKRAVVLTGQLDDPRPAYAHADVILGMGGSALRGLAFGKPLVVQGEQGYWALLTADSCATFLRQGWYGVGTGADGAPRLTAILRDLLADAGRRDTLGRYGRELAVERFSLQRAARVQEEIYREALARPGSVAGGAADGVRAAAGLARYKARRRVQRLRGGVPRDDFNAVVPRRA